MSLLIRNGTAFIGGEYQHKDILLEGGLIKRIGNHLEGDRFIDASGMIVLPGLIDPHVHLREPGDTYKEDFASGSRAAIAGGFTTVIDMPNNALPTITVERLREKEAIAKKKAICDVLFHFGGTDSNFEEIRAADPLSLKLYLGRTTGMMMLKDPGSLEKHYANFPADRRIVLHACDHSVGEEENLEKTYETVGNAIALAKARNRKIHLAHASTKKELTLAKAYNGCSLEVAPHHLFLSTDDRKNLRELAKVFPPLRSEQKRLMLWSALDLVDCIATDHAPHTIEDKEQGAAGFPGLETSLALMFDACSKGLLDKIWVAERMTQNVADIFGIPGKGRIIEGFIGDLTIIDPKKAWSVEALDFQTKCKWSPFEGKELKGKVKTVIKSGKAVYEDYNLVV
jgi:dihydroorotase (multifunctional complex type)